MLSGNKGEWSEVYALLKIIADGNIYRGDGDLTKLSNAVFPIIKILREQSNGTFQYTLNQNLVIIDGAGDRFEISISKFRERSIFLLQQIKNSRSASFTIPGIEDFINSFGFTTLKAKSSSKSDINIILYDSITGISPELGFSIKSQLGSPSTLLNASGSTNFIYKIQKNISEKVSKNINSINSASKIKDRLIGINEVGAKLVFCKTENAIFSNNLTLIDTCLPIILAELVLLFYTTNKNTLIDLVCKVAENNSLKLDLSNNHPFYLYKIKRFLTDIALGMMPAKVWTGQLEATGGYLVIKEDGEILSYHIFNRNDFENYLLNNTKLETPSSIRHNFGSIYEEDGQQYFKLNLQIRFIK